MKTGLLEWFVIALVLLAVIFLIVTWAWDMQVGQECRVAGWDDGYAMTAFGEKICVNTIYEYKSLKEILNE